MGQYKIPCCLCGRPTETPPVGTECECCPSGFLPPALIVEIPDDFIDSCDEPCELDEFGFPVDLFCKECVNPCNNGAGTYQADQIDFNDANALDTACSPFFDTEGCTTFDPCDNAIWLYPFPAPADDCDWCALLLVLEPRNEPNCVLRAELIGPYGTVGGGFQRHGIVWEKEFEKPEDCVAFLQVGLELDFLSANDCCFDPVCCGWGGEPIFVRAA